MGLSGVSGFETVYARVALAGGFLTSVTDRFGLWGPAGSKNVAWGDMQHFLIYTAILNPWLPAVVIPAFWHPGDGIGDCTGHPATRWISNTHGS